jgi:nitroreductase
MDEAARNLLKFIRQRRTARTHTGDALDPALIAELLEAARWAPSAANRQPWEFIVITDRKVKDGLRAAFLDDAREHGARYASVSEKQANLLLAPVLLLVCGDPAAKSQFINAAEIGEAAQEELFLLSMGAAVQNVLLMATALGLSSTWIARPARLAAVGALLGIPARFARSLSLP